MELEGDGMGLATEFFLVSKFITMLILCALIYTEMLGFLAALGLPD